MQVAAGAGFASAQTQEMTSVSAFRFQSNVQIRIEGTKPLSEGGMLALQKIASSTKLSRQDKQTLIRLVALVDEFAGGDMKLMRKIMAIAQVMEMQSTKSYKPMSMKEAYEQYVAERERLRPSPDTIISISTEIEAVSVSYLRMSSAEAVVAADAGVETPEAAAPSVPAESLGMRV